MGDWLLSVDRSVLYAIHGFRAVILDYLAVASSYLGNWGLLWIICAVSMCFMKTLRKYGFVLLIALLLVHVLGNEVIKPLVSRLRPCDALPVENLLMHPPDLYSFPSGHAASSFAAAVIIWAADRKLGVAAFTLAALISWSRVYLFLHYPSDIVCGAALGILCAIIVLKVEEMLSKRLLK